MFTKYTSPYCPKGYDIEEDKINENTKFCFNKETNETMEIDREYSQDSNNFVFKGTYKDGKRYNGSANNATKNYNGSNLFIGEYKDGLKTGTFIFRGRGAIKGKQDIDVKITGEKIINEDGTKIAGQFDENGAEINGKEYTEYKDNRISFVGTYDDYFRRKNGIEYDYLGYQISR